MLELEWSAPRLPSEEVIGESGRGQGRVMGSNGGTQIRGREGRRA